MKKKTNKTVRPDITREINEALDYEPPEDIVIPPDFIEKVMVRIREIGPLNFKGACNQAVAHEPPASVPLPPGWYEQVMAAIRRIGPLKKRSLIMNDEITG